MHRRFISGPQSRDPGGEPQQDLTGVEGYRHYRRGIDQPALEPAIGSLDRHQPVKHLLRAIRQVRPVEAVGNRPQGRHDIACRFRVRTRPARDQAEMPGHTPITRDRVVLSDAQPIGTRLNHRGRPRVVLRQPGIVTFSRKPS